jgi:hypothetical protein
MQQQREWPDRRSWLQATHTFGQCRTTWLQASRSKHCAPLCCVGQASQLHTNFTVISYTHFHLYCNSCRVGCIFPVNVSMLLAFRALQGVARELL